MLLLNQFIFKAKWREKEALTLQQSLVIIQIKEEFPHIVYRKSKHRADRREPFFVSFPFLPRGRRFSSPGITV